jgi:hypothetical protein
MRLSRRKKGVVTVLGIPPLVAEMILELPDLLGADQPEAVRRRLFPDPTDDPDDAAEWRRAQHPELFALLADSKRIVESDLASIGPGPDAGTQRLEIPEAHVAAWISAINAARLAIGALHDLTAADMDPAREPTFDERGVAIFRVDVYAWLQGLLIRTQP